MPKKIEERIHILSPYRGYLAPANVMGPIVHPLVVDKSIVAKILMSGADVYEYIPQNKKTLKLTLTNLNDPNRYTNPEVKPAETIAAPVAPVTKIGVPAMEEPEVKPAEVVEPATEVETETPSVDEVPAAPVEETANSVEVEETDATETAQPASAFVFEYNEDGTVNEDKIEWAKYSKNQRKEIRAQINQHNASLNN